MKLNLCDRPMVELAAAVRRGATSFPAIMEACVERQAETAALNAFTDVFSEDAIALAESYQKMLDHGYDLGPLQGMPIGLKANIAVSGRCMTAGSLLLKDNIASLDAAVTTHLKQAGAVIVGLTNMHEFAWGGTTNNPHYGECRNPWDTRRIPAGSSGGSGVAVAAGSAIATLGTDTGGSVRLPASMNGVTGLRPTIGRVSCEGVFPLAVTMDTVGPIARSSADCAMIFTAIAGEPISPSSSARLVIELERPMAGMTIALIDDYSEVDLMPEISAAFQACVKTLESRGVTIRRIALDGLEVAVDAQIIVDAAEPSAIHDKWVREQPALYGRDVLSQLQAGMGFSAVEYIHAQRFRTFLRQQVDRFYEEVDLILTPTLPFTAPLIGQDQIMIGSKLESTLTGNMRFTCLPSLTGLPAISFPIGFDQHNLPIGAQLMAPTGQEARLLRAVHQFEQHTHYHKCRPVI